MIDLSKVKPDYRVCVYGDEGFVMYILRRSPTGHMKPDAIEGITEDSNGDLCVFAGQMTHRDVQFIKRYSPGVTQRKFKRDVSYQGIIDEDGRITGKYETQAGAGNDHAGKFEMEPVKQEAVAQ